jgi:hypothetical protein
LEKTDDSEFKELHRSNDGILCLKELIIAGKEADYFREIMKTAERPDEKITQYLQKFFS